MFGFGKERVKAVDLVSGFLSTVSRDVGEERLLSEKFKEALAGEGISKARIDRMFKDYDVKKIWFTTICALDALAIQNCYKPNEAAALYNIMHEQLQSAFPGQRLGDVVFGILSEMRQNIATGTSMLHDTAAFAVMNMLNFSGSADTQRLYKKPIFVLMIGMSLIVAAPSYWKKASERYKVVV